MLRRPPKMSLMLHLCVHLALVSIVSASSRVTILIESDKAAVRGRRQSPTSGGVLPEACRNALPVDKETFTFPRGFESVSVPWLRTDLNPLLFTNAALRRNWDKIASLKVRGMNATVREVIRQLQDNNCLFLPWGGSIRDMVLDEPPHDVDAEVSCSQERVISLCSGKFGVDNCEKSPWPGSTKLRIGNERRNAGGANTIEPMDIVQWKDTFEVPPTKWEFTPNSLSYYAMPNNGPQALIDLTGMGFADVCEKKIRIPATDQEWPEWAGELGKQLIKRLRFWKLRVKGFEARDPQTQYFVVDSLKKEFNQSEVLKFYCIYVMDGMYQEDGELGSCTLTDVNPTKLEESKRAFNALFEKDFGKPFWEKVMKPAIDSLPVQRGKQTNQLSEHGAPHSATQVGPVVGPIVGPIAGPVVGPTVRPAVGTTFEPTFQRAAGPAARTSTNSLYQVLSSVASFFQSRLVQPYKR